MTLRPETYDAAAAGSGAAASAWNFILGGNLNIVLGAIVGFLSMVVLMQRFLINRRELRATADDEL
jgi:hypothetical protein